MFLGKLKKLQSQYGLSDKDTLGEYHERILEKDIFKAKNNLV